MSDPWARLVADQARANTPAGPQLAFSSIEDGSVDEYDAAGNLASQIGKQFDGGHGVAVLRDPVPPTPTAAQAEGGLLALTGAWDGFFLNSDGVLDTSIVAPTYFSRVEVHASQDPDFTAEFADTLLDSVESPRGGGVTRTRAPGTWFVRLVARSLSGKRSEASPVVSVVVTPAMEEPDIAAAIRDIQDAADAAEDKATDANTAAVAAQTAAEAAEDDALAAVGIAEGKGELIYQLSAPTGTRAVPQNLWIRTTDNKPHTYDTAQGKWVAVTDQAAIDAAAAAVAAQNAAEAAQADATQALTDAGLALDSASGRVKQFWLESEPAWDGPADSGVWYKEDATGQIIAWHKWNGADWVEKPLSETFLPLVNIGDGTYGELDGIRLEADSIRVQSLIVSDFANAAAGGNFDKDSDLTAWEGDYSSLSIVSVGQHAGAGCLQAIASADVRFISRTIPVVPGDHYLISFWFRSTADYYTDTGGNAKIRIGDSPGGGSNRLSFGYDGPSVDWVQRQTEFVVDSDMQYMNIRVSFDHTAGTAFIDDFEIRLMNAGKLIVDGEVTGEKLSFDAVNGMTVTGALVQTMEDENRGIKLDSFTNTLRAWDPAGNRTFNLDGDTGNFDFEGSMSATGGGTTVHVGPDAPGGRAGLWFDDGSSIESDGSLLRLDSDPAGTASGYGYIGLGAAGANIRGDNIDLIPDTAINFYGPVNFEGDTSWADAALVSGVNGGGGIPEYRMRDGEVRVQGNIDWGGQPGGTVKTVFYLPVGFRPARALTFPASSNTGVAMSVFVQTSGAVQVYTSAATSAYVPLNAIRFDPTI